MRWGTTTVRARAVRSGHMGVGQCGLDAAVPYRVGEVTQAHSATLLVEAVQDYAIFLLAPDGRVLTWNRGAERIKGYTGRRDRRPALRPFLHARGASSRTPAMSSCGWRRSTGDSRTRDGGSARTAPSSGPMSLSPRCSTIGASRSPTPRSPATSPSDERRRSSERRPRGAAGVRRPRRRCRPETRFPSIAAHELKTPIASRSRLSAESLRTLEGWTTAGRLDTGLRDAGRPPIACRSSLRRAARRLATDVRPPASWSSTRPTSLPSSARCGAIRGRRRRSHAFVSRPRTSPDDT